MRGDHDVGQREQRAVGARLLRVHVDAGRAHLARAQCVGQRGLLDQTAARGVDDDHAALGHRQLLGRDHPEGLGGLGQVDGDEVRLAEQLLQRDQPDAELRGTAGLDVGVVGDQGDPEGGQPLGHQHADAAQAHHADGLLGDLDAGELRPLPGALAQRGVGGGDVPGGGQQQRHGVLGGADDVGGGGVDHHDAARGGGGDVDVVQADPGARDDLQVGRRRQGLGVDGGGAAHHHRGRVGQRGQQRGAVGAVDVPDLEPGAEHLQGTGGELLGDEDDGRRRGHGCRA